MSNAFVVSYAARREAADENQQMIEAVFRQLADVRPAGLSYAVFRLDDGVTFVHVGRSEDGGASLPGFTAFQEFTAGIGDRVDAPADPRGASLVGSYGFPA